MGQMTFYRFTILTLDKAQSDEKAQSRQRRDEQYILKRFATQPLSLRWGFETTFMFITA
jgi:hypothetical protein